MIQRRPWEKEAEVKECEEGDLDRTRLIDNS